MRTYNLIFSNKWSQRIKRHFLFWLVIYLYHIMRGTFLYPAGTKLLVLIPTIILPAFEWGVLINMFISYTTVYYLVPKLYQKKKYILFTLSVLAVFFIAFVMLTMLAFINGPVGRSAIGSTAQHPFLFIKGDAIRVLGNPPFICA